MKGWAWMTWNMDVKRNAPHQLVAKNGKGEPTAPGHRHNENQQSSRE